jgi:hypothetical protein
MTMGERDSVEELVEVRAMAPACEVVLPGRPFERTHNVRR